jgi:hypothetical protein
MGNRVIGFSEERLFVDGIEAELSPRPVFLRIQQYIPFAE